MKTKTVKSVMYTLMSSVTTIDLYGIKRYMIKINPVHKVSHQRYKPMATTTI